MSQEQTAERLERIEVERIRYKLCETSKAFYWSVGRCRGEMVWPAPTA